MHLAITSLRTRKPPFRSTRYELTHLFGFRECNGQNTVDRLFKKVPQSPSRMGLLLTRRMRSFLVTISIGAFLVILLSIRTGWFTSEIKQEYDNWNHLTTEEQLERVRKENLNGYQYAAPEEVFDESQLSSSDRTLLKKVLKGSNDRDKRVEAIERLYHVDSADSWNRHLEALDDEGLPPFTKFVQKYMYDHQHPEDCSDKEFIVMSSFPNDEAFGLGALVHSISMNLNIALRYNRILIYNPFEGPGRHFVDDSSLHVCNKSIECFFESLSSCTFDDVRPDNHWKLPAREVLPQDAMTTPSGSIPPIFGLALKKMFPLMTPDAMKYWWRGQATAYIMRFNARTMAELLRKRRNKTLQKSLGFEGENEAIVERAGIPFPMPAGSVSMHVRHGDKGIEMTLKPFEKYLDMAEDFISQNPLGFRKIAFLSTENPEVIKGAADHLQKERELYKVIDAKARTTSDWAWTWYWSDIPRANIGPEDQLKTFGNRTDMTINWFLQLMMAIECDMMIGSRASGWSRLLDGLRCGWLGKCQQPFLDVGDKMDWAFYSI
ncbi:hypothetical protein TWF694_004990 [Orbilia ellipsospora]|uniref:Uncharacterized protein n=1 Tax=Orbilia ellipsospora TaxID=2528407 RepID=A0AAV9WUA4_9PEZI